MSSMFLRYALATLLLVTFSRSSFALDVALQFENAYVGAYAQDGGPEWSPYDPAFGNSLVLSTWAGSGNIDANRGTAASETSWGFSNNGGLATFTANMSLSIDPYYVSQGIAFIGFRLDEAATYTIAGAFTFAGDSSSDAHAGLFFFYLVDNYLTGLNIVEEQDVPEANGTYFLDGVGTGTSGTAAGSLTGLLLPGEYGFLANSAVFFNGIPGLVTGHSEITFTLRSVPETGHKSDILWFGMTLIVLVKLRNISGSPISKSAAGAAGGGK